MTTPTPDEICERLAVQTLLDYRRRDGLTCYAYDSNRVKDEANMKAAFAEIVAPAIQQQLATIERLSAALEDAEKTLHDVRERIADAGSITINDVGVCWLVPDAMMLAIRKCIGPRAALGKDVK